MQSVCRQLGSVTAALLSLTIAATMSAAIPAAAQPDIGSTALTPAVSAGQCWKANQKAMDAWSWSWAAVPCTATHNLITFAVIPVPAVWGDAYVTQPTTEDPPALMVTRMHNTCFSRLRTTLKPYSVKPSHLSIVGSVFWLDYSRVNGTFYSPTRAQWTAGQHWVRCDIGVDAFGAAAAPGLVNLPRTLNLLLNQIKANPTFYAECEDVDWNFADCRRSPKHVVNRLFDLRLRSGEPYPGTSVVKARAKKACAARGRQCDWFDWPSALGWARGYVASRQWKSR